jgi:hypothetical protein
MECMCSSANQEATRDCTVEGSLISAPWIQRRTSDVANLAKLGAARSSIARHETTSPKLCSLCGSTEHRTSAKEERHSHCYFMRQP